MITLVLIVEDNPIIAMDIAEIVETKLKAKSMIVTKVSDGLKVDPKLVSLALLDIEIQEGTSYPIARKMIANNIPVIFISGNKPDTLPDDLKDVAFLSKPFVAERLVLLANSLYGDFSQL